MAKPEVVASEPDVKVSKTLCARGDYCGRRRYSAWVLLGGTLMVGLITEPLGFVQDA